MSTIKLLVDYFSQDGLVARYNKGALLYTPGDPLRKTMMIRSGLVKIFDTDSYGNEHTVSIFGPNNIIPLVWLIQRRQDVNFFYQAISDTEVYAVDTKNILAFIREQPDILMFLLSTLTKAYLNQDARIFSLQRANTRERLDFVLYYLAQRLGSISGSIAKLPGLLTHAELANLMGVTRESVSRELGRATASGLLWKDDAFTYIDLSKIKNKNLPPVFRM